MPGSDARGPDAAGTGADHKQVKIIRTHWRPSCQQISVSEQVMWRLPDHNAIAFRANTRFGLVLPEFFDKARVVSTFHRHDPAVNPGLVDYQSHLCSATRHTKIYTPWVLAGAITKIFILHDQNHSKFTFAAS
jgi:hypothetical protein